MVALGTQLDAVYYNPANLSVLKVSHLGLGLNVLEPDLFVARSAPGEGELAPLLPTTNMAFRLGASTTLGGVFDDKVGFGIVLFHPLLTLTRVESVDPAPYFYRYNSLPNKLIVAAAASYEPLPWLRLGLGGQILAQFSGRVDAALSLAETRFTREALDVELLYTVAPTAGLSLGPFHGLRLGVAFRGQLDLLYEIPVRVLIEEIGDLLVHVRGTALFTPHQVAAGLSWQGDVGDGMTLAVEAGLTWAGWSAAPPAGASVELLVDDSVLRAEDNAAGRPVQNILQAEQVPVALGAKDTVTPRLGVELLPTPEWAVRAGWFYRPTPLPVPIWESNTLDATANVFSLGGGYTFKDPTRIHRDPLSLDIALQLTALKERRVPKAAGGTVTGEYRFGGLIWSVSLDLHHSY
jgi:hypothetical protein